MGGQPSKTAAGVAHEKAALERLRSLKVEEDEESCYVEVSGDGEKAAYGQVPRQPEALPSSSVELWLEYVMKDPKNRLALTTLSATNPKQALISPSTMIADRQIFNIKIPFEGAPITNQKSSGRCWLFASTNVFRVALMKRYGLESFELSQSYLFYWDKLEKANWFLEQIVDTAHEDLDSRVVQTLLGDLVSDGGQWDMVYNLVDKYGLVPQSLYPDSWNALNSGTLNSIIKTKLRQYALILRGMANMRGLPAAAIPNTKIRMYQEIALIMTLLLGPPPKSDAEFKWEYLDKDGKARELRTTPKAFARDISSPELRISSSVIEGMISLVHDPRHEPLTKLTVSRLGNVVGGRAISYINVEMATLKAACVKMLRAGLPIFFGCDVGKFSDSASGIMDLDLFDYEAGLGTSLLHVSGIMDLDLFDYEAGLGTSLLRSSKAERLRTGESQMTHAMVLTAVHVDDKTGKPVRWRVQNSWGTGVGDKGWFVMSDAWMDEFVYQAVVDPRFCGKEVRDVIQQEAIVLPLWDPMGSLA